MSNVECIVHFVDIDTIKKNLIKSEWLALNNKKYGYRLHTAHI